MKYCPECGEKQEVKSKFCPNCGFNIVQLNQKSDIDITNNNEEFPKEISKEEDDAIMMMLDNSTRDEFYEGEIKDGLRDGKGIEYSRFFGDTIRFKIYEGDWIQDKRNGMGIEYDSDGNVIYYGEWFNDKYHGIGIQYEKGSIIYEGLFKEGCFVLSANIQTKEPNKNKTNDGAGIR